MRGPNEPGSPDSLDVTYSTFWNDWTHYSYYLHSADGSSLPGGLSEISDAKMAYDDLSNTQENILFAEKSDYIEQKQSLFPFDYTEERGLGTTTIE